MKAVYIASPYTIGDKEENVRVSLIAADILIDAGYVPYTPLLSHYWHTSKDYEVWLRLDLAWVERCDCLLRLPGKSSGADREVAHAKKIGMPVYFGLSELLSWEAR